MQRGLYLQIAPNRLLIFQMVHPQIFDRKRETENADSPAKENADVGDDGRQMKRVSRPLLSEGGCFLFRLNRRLRGGKRMCYSIHGMCMLQ